MMLSNERTNPISVVAVLEAREGMNSPPFVESNHTVSVGVNLDKEVIELGIRDGESCSTEGSFELWLRDFAVLVMIDAFEQIQQLTLRLLHEGAEFLIVLISES
jgi:hypothetical protein